MGSALGVGAGVAAGSVAPEAVLVRPEVSVPLTVETAELLFPAGSSLEEQLRLTSTMMTTARMSTTASTRMGNRGGPLFRRGGRPRWTGCCRRTEAELELLTRRGACRWVLEDLRGM